MLQADKAYMDALQARADAMALAVRESASEWTPGPGGTVRYVAADGDDANDGLSPQSPLRTAGKVSELPLKPGDVVLFRRGDLFRGHLTAQAGVTYSAYGEGPKPTLTVSERDYADPALWLPTGCANVWVCALPISNAGILTFDHDPLSQIPDPHVVHGKMRIRGKAGFENYTQLAGDLEFWSDLDAKKLYLYSETNPGARFGRIEIGTRINVITPRGDGVTIDNLHVTGTGAHGVGSGTVKALTVRSCFFDWLGGSILNGFAGGNTTRYGNAVEIYGGCDGYFVHNNHMFEIYDTGITHQVHDDREHDYYQNDIEYRDNLIEYCFWSIEAYNMRNRHGEQTNIWVHDNFCRFGGYGWGCAGRETSAPMISFGHAPEVSRNYVTEHNTLENCLGWMVLHSGKMEENPLIFRANTYVQRRGAQFANFSGDKVYFDDSAPAAMAKYYGETDGTYVAMPEE